MAYVNRGYQYHSHATVPVLQQPRPPPQHPSNRETSHPSARRPVPVTYPAGQNRSYYAQNSSGTGSRGSTFGPRSNSSHSHSTPQSQSLGGSKASVANRSSGKSSLHQEYHDKKVQRSLRAPYFGRGKSPFLIALCLTVVGGLFIIAAGVVFGLRFHNNIMLTIDKGEIIGPILVAVGLACIAGAIKFYFDAYAISNKERRRLQFSPTSDNMIRISTINASLGRRPGEPIVSGTASTNAVTRTPQGARSNDRPDRPVRVPVTITQV